jgi:toxin ParE1/3/4
MAYKLIWSPASRPRLPDHLRDILSFISRDSRQRAETFGYRLIAETDKLRNFSEIGRVVPEYGVPTIREIIVRSYRIVYRVDHERKLVEVARVWHAARGTPEL